MFPYVVQIVCIQLSRKEVLRSYPPAQEIAPRPQKTFLQLQVYSGPPTLRPLGKDSMGQGQGLRERSLDTCPLIPACLSQVCAQKGWGTRW